MTTRSRYETIRAAVSRLMLRHLGVAPEALEVTERFRELGIDSAAATAIASELSVETGQTLGPTVLWEYPNIEALTRFLCEDRGQRTAAMVDAATHTAKPRGALPEAATPRGTPPACRPQDIAVIGMACRFPGAPDLDSFWNLLAGGKDAVDEIPEHRFPRGAEQIPGARRAGMLDDVAGFDPGFFSISPREAAEMDPQQRLTLELCWEALVDAGVPALELRGTRTAVYIGAMWRDYASLNRGALETLSNFTATGEDLSILSGRASYFLGLEGPSLTVNTACSSSLVAVHLACRSIESGECALAIAGGINLILDVRSSVVMSRMGALSSDGRCKAFDARADGYVRGEGAGLVVLKPLDQALAGGDRIHCVIRGSAMNSDGYSNGLTAPNPRQQANVLREAWAKAGIAPAMADYIEAHGTGTALGDPIEAAALGEVFSVGRTAALRIGSVKTNLGHLEAAAGIAGLIKCALMLRRAQLAPSLHFENANPRIPFDALRLAVQTRLEEWSRKTGCCAGVSSFGFGGTNCHVVLASAAGLAPPSSAESQTAGPSVFVLSAHTGVALRGLVARTAEFLRGASPCFEDACRTSTLRRSHLSDRAAFVASDLPGLIALLEDRRETDAHAVFRGRRPASGPAPVAFVFNGQGSLAKGMLNGWPRSETAFATTFALCAEEIRARAGWDLERAAEAGEGLQRTSVAQLVLFSMQASLHSLLKSWGIAPAAVIGHSAGEVAAAWAAGVLDLEQAIELLHLRGQAMESRHGLGAMLAVSDTAERVAKLLGSFPGLEIAAMNAPRSTVCSGARDRIEALEHVLLERRTAFRRLDVAYAFHSAQMEEAARTLRDALGSLRQSAPLCDVVSSVTGGLQDAGGFDAAYWARNVREPVRFEAGIRALLGAGIMQFVEVGATSVLANGIFATAAGDARLWVGATACNGRPDRGASLRIAARLFTAGHAIQWKSLYPAAGKPIDLPGVPWQRQHLWLTPPAAQQPPRDTVRQYYASLLRVSGPGEFLRFGAFREPRPGFSWLRPWLDPGHHADELAVAIDAVSEATSVLLKPCDLHRATAVLDIGCGYAADLIALAESHPQMRLRGCNISPEQVEMARARVAARGLAERIEILEADSRVDAIPGSYDLILSLQVAHHIREKDALFKNIAPRLAEGGTWVFAEVLARVESGIDHAASSAWFAPPAEWARLLAENRLRAVACVDASREVANFLSDPEFEAHAAQLASRCDRNLLDHLRGPADLARLLEKGLAQYTLLAARRDDAASSAELLEHNNRRLAAPLSYAMARDCDRSAWYAGEPAAQPAAACAPVQMDGEKRAPNRAQIRALIAEVLHARPEEIDCQRPLGEFGVDSILALEIRWRLELLSARALPATLLFNYPTVDRLAEFLTGAPMPVAAIVHAAQADAAREPIAIVGIGCRFPGGASDPDSFWQLLANGGDAVSEVPLERWDATRYYDSDPAAPGKCVMRRGAFIAGVDQFEPGFFGIAPREAARMDPQQRIALEVAWEALESAGLPADKLAGARAGVWLGVMSNDYAQINYARAAAIDAHSYAGYSFVANRISHALDLRGPSIAVDTACSSSLVAVHQACRSLRGGETDLALAGGVNLMLTPALSINYSKWGMLSKRGRCSTFDAGADGFVRGEGCGMVALKRLSDALRDGDRIWACIRGTATGQDGRTNVFTAPSGLAQRRVMLDALADAAVDPGTIDFVETHGTGTALGDPIEAESLADVYGRAGADPCYLGAVKTNLGHLEGAAGIAGLIKAALALHHGAIPPNLHFRALNPHVHLEDTRLRLPLERVTWSANRVPRRAAVSSFGAGGTNAHAILEEAPRSIDAQPEPDAQPWRVLALSARGVAALRAFVQRVRAALPQDDALDDYCYSAALRRTAHSDRAAVVFRDRQDLAHRLDAWLAGEPLPNPDGVDSRVEEMARAWAAGEDVDWITLFSGPRGLAPLPLYPWQRSRYWADDAKNGADAGGPRIARLHPEQRIWSADLKSLKGHKLNGAETAPAALWLDLLTTVGAELFGAETRAAIRALRLPTAVAGASNVLIHVDADRPPAAFHVFAELPERGWTLAAEGLLESTERREPAVDWTALDLRREQVEPFAPLYERFKRHGLEHTQAFAGAQSIVRGNEHAMVRISIVRPAFRTAWLDCCLQALAAADTTRSDLLLPIGVEEFVLYAEPAAREVLSLAAIHERTATEIVGDMRVTEEDGQVLAVARGVRMRGQGAIVAGEARVHEIRWQPTDPPAPSGSMPHRSLLLCSDSPAGNELAASLRGRGVRVRAAHFGASFAQDKIDSVIFAADSEASGWEATARDCASLLEAIQQAARSTVRHFDLITGAAAPAGGETVNPAAAALAGLARSAALELPEIRFRIVDLPSRPDGEAFASLTALLAAEETNGEWVFRNRGWLRPSIADAGRQHGAPPIDADNAYVITGGLGAIGRRVCTWLIARGAAHILLLGRTARPEFDAQIAGWRAAGIDVQFAQADVARRDELAAALKAMRRPVRGVFHAAGILDDRSIRALTRERLEHVLAPKVAGALHLHALCRDADLFVLFSSVAAYPGSPGQAAYAASNAFLDGLAHLRRAAGRHAVSINWGPWSGEGMTASLAPADWRRWESKGLRAMAPESAIEAMEKVLASGAAQRIVAAGDLAARPAELAVHWLDVLWRAAPADRFPLLVERVAQLAAEVMQLKNGERLKPRDSFFECGFDSLMALDLRNRLDAEFGIGDLRSTVAFDYPTPAEMAKHLWDRIGGDASDGLNEPPGACAERASAPLLAGAMAAGQESYGGRVR